MDDIQLNINDTDYNEDMVLDENYAKFELEKILIMEESFWHEKSRIKLHREGDRNMTLFHNTAQIKKSFRKIASLEIDNLITIEPTVVVDHVVSHFTNLFSSNNTFYGNGLMEKVVHPLINKSTNTFLTLLPSRFEIRNVAFPLNKDGAHGI